MLSVRKTTEVELQRDYLYKMHIITSNVLPILTKIAPDVMKNFGNDMLSSIDTLNKDFPGMSKHSEIEKMKWMGQTHQFIKNGDSSGEGDVSFYSDENGYLRDIMVLLRNCSVYMDDSEFWLPILIEKYDVDRKTVSQRDQYNFCKITNVSESKRDKGSTSVTILTIHMTWNECVSDAGDIYVR